MDQRMMRSCAWFSLVAISALCSFRCFDTAGFGDRMALPVRQVARRPCKLAILGHPGWDVWGQMIDHILPLTVAQHWVCLDLGIISSCGVQTTRQIPVWQLLLPTAKTHFSYPLDRNECQFKQKRESIGFVLSGSGSLETVLMPSNCRWKNWKVSTSRLPLCLVVSANRRLCL